ncbi:MAG: hypothetical protein HQK53_19405, partial [Oligoflexia bacterium]|nr:hypothetical protein [Oligoflexia bacterium]
MKKIIFLVFSMMILTNSEATFAENNPNFSVFKYFRTEYPSGEKINAVAFDEFFKGTMETVPLLPSELPKNFPYKVILVRGLFTGLYTDITKVVGLAINLPDGIVNAFYDVRSWLTALGIENSLLPSNTQMGSIADAKELRDEILASDKPVLLMTHCKGGIDALYALVNHPEIRKKVVGWVSIQSLFYGTKIIDHIVSNPILLKITSDGILKSGGDPKSLYDTTSVEARKFMEKNGKKIADILNKIPVISIGSRFVSPPLYSLSPLKTRSFLDATNTILSMSGDVNNDGLVSTEGTCPKGSVCIFLDNFDHAAAVMSLAPFFSISHEERLQFAWSVLN